MLGVQARAQRARAVRAHRKLCAFNLFDKKDDADRAKRPPEVIDRNRVGAALNPYAK
jgi:hypothetical protein